MPTLDFKGKNYVYSHHLSVPFRELKIDAKKSKPAKGEKPSMDDNLVIHGDNLHALKALLPRHAGKIKCIYIDPPYNTGKEKWHYNDNVNSPLIRQWLKDNANPVDKADMERHEKWLCMMWPRLSLLKELLSHDGLIFISIDDNEMHRLRLLMDEIFGDENFLGQISVMVNPKGRGLKGEDFAKTHEYLIAYQGTQRKENIGKEKSDEKVEKEYREIDDEGQRYRALELRNTHREFGKHNRANLYYPFYVNDDLEISLDAKQGYEPIYPIWDDGYEGCWTWDSAKAARDMDILLARKVNGKKKIYRKSYPTNVDGKRVKQKIKTIWLDKVFFTEKGRADLQEVLPDSSFEFPKPVELIKEVVSLFPAEDLIVLDSFAGAGTTGQAVTELNYMDGEKRKFIMVEMGTYANDITAERVRRIIDGVPSAQDDSLKKGLNGSFTFCELGEAFDIDKILSGESLPSHSALASYVFYTVTGQALNSEAKPSANYFIGESEQYDVYLIYKDDISYLRSNDSALNQDKLDIIAAHNPKSKKQKVVFATAKYMSQDALKPHNIVFCQIPYAIHKIAGN